MKITITNGDAYVKYEPLHGERILYSGLRNGFNLSYECAIGTCGSCVAKKVSGTAEWLWTNAPNKQILESEDKILMCQCVARSDLTLKINQKAIETKSHDSTPNPSWFVGKITRSEEIAPDVKSLTIQLPSPIKFLAGQFAVLEFSEIPGFRAWSMTNYEPETTTLDFVIKRKPGGKLSEILFESKDLSPKIINLFGPLGKAYYETHNPNNLICIAGGTGVAGMLSILKSFAANNEKSSKNAQLFFGVRKNQDLFFGNELNNLVDQGKGAIEVNIAISDDEIDKNLKERFPLLNFEKGLVHDVALQKIKTEDLSRSIAYIAGPPPLVNACIKIFLLELKFQSNRIFFDKFN